MTEFMVGSLAAGKIGRGEPSANPPEPKQLTFELDDKAKKDIKTAERNFEELVGNHELEVGSLHFQCGCILSYLGLPLRRSGQKCLQGVQDFARCHRSDDQAASLPQTQWPTGRVLRKCPNAQIRSRKDGGHSIRQLRKQGMGGGYA